MMPMTETSGDDAVEEWSTPVNGKKTLSSRQNGEEWTTVQHDDGGWFRTRAKPSPPIEMLPRIAKS